MTDEKPIPLLDKLIAEEKDDYGIYDVVLSDHPKECPCELCKMMRTIKGHMDDLVKVRESLEQAGKEMKHRLYGFLFSDFMMTTVISSSLMLGMIDKEFGFVETKQDKEAAK